MNIEPYLEKHTSALVDELRDFISSPLPEEVRCVEVMVFREAMPGNPFRIFFLDRFKGPAKSINNFVPMANLSTLVDSPDYISREEAIAECLGLDDESDQDLCMEETDRKYSRENLKLAQWFSQCWLAAGGANYTYSAFIVEEDFQFNPINLQSGQHIKHLHDYKKVFDG